MLCHYGFRVRGLQRLQIETLSDNAATPRSAEHDGFVREGVLRSSAKAHGLRTREHRRPQQRPQRPRLPARRLFRRA